MTDLERVLDNIAARAEETKEVLCDLIRFPSVHGGEMEVQQYLHSRLAAEELPAELRTIPDAIRQDPEYTRTEQAPGYGRRANLLVRLPGRGKGRSIILNSHTDVVPAAEWADAFTPVVRGDTVIGRGACDAKGHVAALYLLLTAIRQAGVHFEGEVIAQMVIEEEVGGNGSLALIRDGVKADGAIVMESSRLRVHPANRGAIWFRIAVEGKPVHMGRITEGISAIDQMQEMIGILKEYEKQLVADAAAHPLFRMHARPAQVNVGTMQAGDWPATVPGRAVIEGGIGFLPPRRLDDVRNGLRQAIEERSGPWLRGHYTLEFPKLHNDAFETPTEHPLVTTLSSACERCRVPPGISGMLVSCDARLFSKVGGMPTVVFGPGNLDYAHSNQEQIDVKDIVKAAQILAVFLSNWCGVSKS